MATTAPDTGTGTTIAFGTSTFSARVMSISIDGAKFQKIDTTYLGTTTARSAMRSDLYDAGGCTLEIQFPPTTLFAAALATASETITITFPGGGTLIATGWIAEHGNIQVNDEALMTATIKVEFTGAFTGSLTV